MKIKKNCGLTSLFPEYEITFLYPFFHTEVTPVKKTETLKFSAKVLSKILKTI